MRFCSHFWHWTHRFVVSTAALFFLLAAPPSFGAIGDIYPSPDGSRLASQYINDDYELVIHIWERDAQSQTWRIVATVDREVFPVWDPVWSPDSTKIAMKTTSNDKNDVAIVNADGSGYKNLGLQGQPDLQTGTLELAWSPDSSKIAYIPWPNVNGQTSVWVMNADGTNRVSIDNKPITYADIGWHGPENRVSYLETFDGDYYWAKADGSESPKPAFPLDVPTPTVAGVGLATLRPTVSAVSPGSIASVFGAGFAYGSSYTGATDDDGLLSTNEVRFGWPLIDACVFVGGQLAPIFAVTPTQFNIQVPVNLAPGPHSVVAARNCGGGGSGGVEKRSTPFTITIEAATPAFFTYYIAAGDTIAPHGYVAARHASDSAAVTPLGAIAGLARPARPGDLVEIYGTGWGRTTPAAATGELAPGAATLRTEANPKVAIGGVQLAPEDLLYVGLAPGTAGLYQLNIRIPETAAPGNQELTLTVYGKTSPTGPVIPIAEPE